MDEEDLLDRLGSPPGYPRAEILRRNRVIAADLRKTAAVLIVEARALRVEACRLREEAARLRRERHPPGH